MLHVSIPAFEVVLAIAEHGTFTHAARALGYTQSAVSRQVAAVEETLGEALFERGPRGAVLTDAGRKVVAHGAAIVRQADALMAELAAPRSAVRLRVGAFSTAWVSLAPLALKRFASSHPGAQVQLSEGTSPAQLRRLRAGSADLALVSLLPGQELDVSRVVLEPLLEDPLLVAVARTHPLSGSTHVELEDIANEPWVVGSKDPAEHMLGLVPGAGVTMSAYVARDWMAKLGLVAAGLGVALVPGLAAAGVREDVVLVRISGPVTATRTVALATAHARDAPAGMLDFAASLRSAAKTVAGDVERRLRAE